jgi:hypothetical protein
MSIYFSLYRLAGEMRVKKWLVFFVGGMIHCSVFASTVDSFIDKLSAAPLKMAFCKAPQWEWSRYLLDDYKETVDDILEQAITPKMMADGVIDYAKIRGRNGQYVASAAAGLMVPVAILAELPKRVVAAMAGAGGQVSYVAYKRYLVRKGAKHLLGSFLGNVSNINYLSVYARSDRDVMKMVKRHKSRVLRAEDHMNQILASLHAIEPQAERVTEVINLKKYLWLASISEVDGVSNPASLCGTNENILLRSSKAGWKDMTAQAIQALEFWATQDQETKTKLAEAMKREGALRFTADWLNSTAP